MYSTAKISTLIFSALLSISLLKNAHAEHYQIDTEGAHAFIQFKIKHLGYSWLHGQFNTFTGSFNYDENNPSTASIQLDIDVTSLDSNHAKRDKHLRGKDFLNVDKYPLSTFVSTSFQQGEDGKAVLKGDFTLHGVTKNISIDVEPVGHGPDPWGGYRRGFSGTTMIKPAEFGIEGMEKLGPHSTELYLQLSIEGIRKNAPKGFK